MTWRFAWPQRAHPERWNSDNRPRGRCRRARARYHSGPALPARLDPDCSFRLLAGSALQAGRVNATRVVIELVGETRERGRAAAGARPPRETSARRRLLTQLVGSLDAGQLLHHAASATAR